MFPSAVVPYIGLGLLISLFLIFVARPVAVFLSLAFFKMKMRRRLYISWVGLRGAVPIVFATYPLLAGIEKADTIFNIVFFIAITSVLLQGTTLSVIAKWLHVALPEKVKPSSETDKLIIEVPKSVMKTIEINDDCPAIDKKIVSLNFPKNAIIAMIKRGDKYLTPHGSTKIEAGDLLYVLSENEAGLEQISDCLQVEQV